MMVKLEYKQLKFVEKENDIEVKFLRIFYFNIEKKDLFKIGKYSIEENSITFDNPNAENKFNQLLDKGFNNLYNSLSKNKTIYVHKHSGIPLLGSNSFGLVDRGSNLVEIKPITSCNLNCIFCSVDEGIDTKKKLDFVVEKDYLIQEFKKILKIKKNKVFYAYINVHGEPMLYSEIFDLVKDLKKLNVIVGIITNGSLLNKDNLNKLKESGLDRINISLNAYDKEVAKKLAGTHYDVERILENIKYANSIMETVIAPVYLKGLNDDEMIKIINFAKSIQKGNFPIVGIQNFLAYKLGRNPVKQASWDYFNEFIKQFDYDLSGKNLYPILKDNTISKPIKKNEILNIELICSDRYRNQSIGIYKDRTISVLNYAFSKKEKIKVKIIRDKDNIFTALKV
jgi:uncharacterized protein